MRIIATLGWKYEPSWLIDDLMENLKGWVDDFAIIDCRDRTHELWINEYEYRLKQRAAAEKLNADWVLVTSADERFEKGAGEKIRALTKEKHKTIYKFRLREMFEPDKYRIDGIWGRKNHARLYPLYEGQVYQNKKLHTSPVPKCSYPRISTNVNIYHLKMIEPENRLERARVFKQLDPSNRLQRQNSKRIERIDTTRVVRKLGYDYLSNTDGMVLEKIPKGREFNPPYTKKYEFNVRRK